MRQDKVQRYIQLYPVSTVLSSRSLDPDGGEECDNLGDADPLPRLVEIPAELLPPLGGNSIGKLWLEFWLDIPYTRRRQKKEQFRVMQQIKTGNLRLKLKPFFFY